ncbi:hypothetical protein [Streptomyces sp. KR80]|uniref:hypothetical protein n=1 Tax=Streptomyces sp. KR80 TaxID=3457426 RepID=UPI003FD667DC
MNRTQRRALARGVIGLVATVVAGAWPMGTAQADETPTHAHNGPRVGLINTGQVDDPMEDVLEHTLLFGDRYTWK